MHKVIGVTQTSIEGIKYVKVKVRFPNGQVKSCRNDNIEEVTVKSVLELISETFEIEQHTIKIPKRILEVIK